MSTKPFAESESVFGNVSASITPMVAKESNMDQVLKRAEKHRDELVQRRKKLSEQLALIDRELNDLDGFFAVAARFGSKEESMQDAARQLASLAFNQWPGPGEQAKGVPLNGLIAGAQSLPHGSKTKVIVNLARELIKLHGPMSARRILELIDKHGQGEALIPGRDEKGRTSYLSAVLSKDGRFESDRDAGGYKLAEPEGPQLPFSVGGSGGIGRIAEIRGGVSPGRKPQQNPYRQKVNPGAENTGDADDLV